MQNPKSLIDKMLKLPLKKRVLAVERLLLSVHGQIDPEVDAAWAKEVRRRAAQIDRGEVKLVPWSVVRAKLWKRLHAAA